MQKINTQIIYCMFYSKLQWEYLILCFKIINYIIDTNGNKYESVECYAETISE